jgi:hypothetical protein
MQPIRMLYQVRITGISLFLIAFILPDLLNGGAGFIVTLELKYPYMMLYASEILKFAGMCSPPIWFALNCSVMHCKYSGSIYKIVITSIKGELLPRTGRSYSAVNTAIII